MILYATRLIN